MEKTKRKRRKTKRNKVKEFLIIILFLFGLGGIIKLAIVGDVRKEFDDCYLTKQEQELVENVKITNNQTHRLPIESSYGDIDAYHPKVLYFKNGWHGYLYWMAYTPYPHSNDKYENPHIMASNDMINWEKPRGLKNPLDTPQNIDKYHCYNSDPHLVYNDDLDRLELFFRYVDYGQGKKSTLYKMVSKDGVHWESKQIILKSDNMNEFDFLSPVVIYENGIYKMWYANAQRTLTYVEMKGNQVLKKTEKEIKIDYGQQLKSWHLDIIKTKKGYEMLIVAYPNWDFYHFMNLYYAVSEDGINFSKATMVMSPPTNKRNWNGQGLYRSSFIYKDGIYYVWYSGRGKGYRGIGLAFGKDIYHLKTTDIDFSNDKLAVLKFRTVVKRETCTKK